MLAQAEPLGGASGWTGAGLLGLVLAWLLFKHLPDKDRMTTALVDKHDAATAAIVEKHDLSTSGLTEAFRAELAEMRKTFERDSAANRETFKAETLAERQACDKHFETLAGAVAKGNEATIQAVKAIAEQSHNHSVRTQQQTELYKQEIARLEAQRRAEAEKAGGS